MSTEPVKKCEHCGASLKSYWHTLTPGLVSILIKAVKFVSRNNINKFHYKDLDLNYTEASNLQKLRFHALIAHHDPEKQKGGYWLITKRGGQFLRGEIKVPKKVETFRNRVLAHSDQRVHISEVRNKLPIFEQTFDFNYQLITGELDKPSTLF